MGGIEATAEIRRLEAADGRHTPIIALTAHAMQGDRERCEQASMNGYASKPIHRDELFTEIDRLIEVAAPKLSYTGEAEFLAKLAGMFLVDYPQQMQEVRNALAQRNARGSCARRASSKKRPPSCAASR
jgi:CheY-like chemotaxis protein